MSRRGALRFEQSLRRPFTFRRWTLLAGYALLFGLISNCVGQLPAQPTGAQVKGSASSFPPPHWVRKFGASPGLSYVGGRVCAECHPRLPERKIELQ